MAWTRVNTDIATILEAVQQKVIDDGIFDAVYISLQPQPLKYPPSDQYVIITPGRQPLDQGSTAGGGRDYNFVKGDLVLTIWSRLILDEVPRDNSYLTNVSLGALRKLKCCINSFQMFDPTNLNEDYILGEPMRFKAIEVPEKTGIPGWGYCAGVWEMNYTLDLSC